MKAALGVAEGMRMDALGEVFSALETDQSLPAYAAAARKLKSAEVKLEEFRAAILANHTFEIPAVLGVECARRGRRAVFYQAGYDQYRQELLDPASGLDRFRPDAVLLSLHLETTFPGLSGATCAATRELPVIDDWIAGLRSLLATWRERSAAPVFLLDFIPTAGGMDGTLEAAGGCSLFDWILELNRAMRRMASELAGVFAIPAAKLAAESGLAEWRDSRFWYLARAGINPKRFPALAALVARHFAALWRPAAKCLVLDLDNTLWGGILGEAGAEGIQCGDGDYPANAYAEFQRAVLALRSRGVLLAVASKNDAALVEEAFRLRTMPLSREHVSDWEVHWDPKPESLQRIAARLNIGLDSLVFLDDNPAEIELVKQSLPMVRAYRLPARPEQFAEFLSRLEDFDQLRLSSEDLRRAELYEIRKRQTEMAAAATDLESFYRSLRTVLAPERAGPANFDRIVQLIQKTNQFNLTTRRHTKSDLEERLDRGAELWGFRASDVHGDHGLIAVALLDFKAGACTIDTLLMSCRVIGRTLETAILHFLEGRALARGADEVRGEYLPTPKNGPCRDFYRQHGFTGDGSLWTKDIRTRRTARPEWITIAEAMSEACART